MKNTFILLTPILVLLAGCVTPQTPNSLAPNVAAEAARQTKESYQAQEDFFNAQATSTSAAQTQIALAPVVAMTQTAGEFAMQQTYAQATTTSAALTQTAYADQQALIAQSTSTAGVATQVAAFTQQAFLVQQDKDMRAAQRREINNWLLAIAPPVVLVSLVAWGLITFSRSQRKKPIERDENGKTKPIIDIVTGKYIDLNASPNYFDEDMSLLKQMFVQYLQNKYGFVPAMPQITAERQDRTKEREQIIEVERLRRSRLPKALIDSQGMKFLPEPMEEEIADLEAAEMLLPEWDIIQGWNGQSRPLGLGAKGIIVAQAASPHLLTTGGTGSGKTAFMLRTQATVSLAKGYQVINIGFSNSGFGVFSGHPNYHAIELTQSSDVIDCLASVYKELKERKQIIGGESIEWEHWRHGEKPPRPFVDVLIDELGNLADDIYTSEETSKEGAVKTRMLWRWMSMIAKEGRKVGIRFIAALQDPTAKSVELGFRRNCTLVSFQLGDASQSRSFIGAAGAELLQVGHFMTRNYTGNEGIVVGGGFAPSDDEIRVYLRGHAVPATPAPAWIDGVVINSHVLPKQESIKLAAPAPTTKMSVEEFVNNLSEWEVKVLDFYEAGMDQIAIVQSLFADDNPEIGKVAVADLIQRWRIVKGIDIPQTQQPVPQKPSEESMIRDLHAQGKSVSAIVREVWGVSGGGQYATLAAKVRAVIGTSSSRQTPPNGLFSAA